ncbi:LANO_0A03664g1_1 [Lachancea nothofagi CBS 11611]|uniref:LANO_0A03664g1_1 n=1 Tax=Lachancea nothofagi CBS 11611 TaxID=1266666 RepID=A0A1G4IQ53_9SACH|nr:LANO_0A03664g1_1 [Lachancea nothofagi CBS 11611]
MLRNARYTALRTIKTLHTPIYDGSDLKTRQNLLHHIALLEKVLLSASYDRSMLYSGKYKRLPQIISGNDTVNVNYVMKEFLTSVQLAEAENPNVQRNPATKLGKIGLQMFMDCHQDNITALGTSLTNGLFERYNRNPTQEMAQGIELALTKVRTFLQDNRILVQEPHEIDQLVEKICSHNQKNAAAIKKVLSQLDYNLVSDDVVRVTRGRRTDDETEVSKGWKYPTGIIDSNEAYLRSLQIPKNNLVSVNSPMLVLVHDGTLKDANNVLPALHYAAKQKKSLFIIVNGECKGDALAAITINNNKNKRQNVDSQAIIAKYSARDHNGLTLQENVDFLKFLKLPQGLGSVYSPDFSEYVPSSASAAQFFGSLESLKATTGEAFLYNSGTNIQNAAMRTTVTLLVGGQSEFEIDHRRAELDHIINNVLCHGMAQGWIPGHGIALAKSIKPLENVSKQDPFFLGIEAVVANLTTTMENALNNLYGAHKYQAAKLIAETIFDPEFTTAFLPHRCSVVDRGVLEPWNKVDQTLGGVMTFIKLITTCDVLVTRFFDKPRKD